MKRAPGVWAVRKSNRVGSVGSKAGRSQTISQPVNASLASTGAEIFSPQDEQLLAREVGQPALELLGVEAPRHIGVSAVVPCAKSGVDEEPLALSGQALLLRVERSFEGEPLAALASHHLVVRVRALDGITQERDQ